MTKLLTLLLLLVGHTCLAQKLQLSLTSGYRQENLRWSIAGNANGQNPNILSELQWKNVGGLVTGAQLQVRFFNHWLLEGEYEHTFFSTGKVTDTDYSGNDRTNSVYAQQFNAGKGGSDSWQTGLGYQLLLTKTFPLTPSAGYGQFLQSFYLSGIPNLNSTYKTTWQGLYGQVLMATPINKQLSIDAGFRYNQVQYKATANWNLIREFQHPESFRHTANGYGLNVHASFLYRASRIHSIGIKGSYSRWETGRGIDELYLANGSSEQTQLNEVRSTGWQVMLTWRISLATQAPSSN